jgi:predicted nucleic acid-binding protein
VDPVYLDASALVKLVAREAETDALMAWLRDRPVRMTSVLSKIEVMRAARRVAAETEDRSVVGRASAVIASVAVAGVSDAIAARAGVADPLTLRSLDAVHLATAVLAGPLDSFVAYDERLADAARVAGINVAQPGRTTGR